MWIFLFRIKNRVRKTEFFKILVKLGTTNRSYNCFVFRALSNNFPSRFNLASYPRKRIADVLILPRSALLPQCSPLGFKQQNKNTIYLNNNKFANVLCGKAMMKNAPAAATKYNIICFLFFESISATWEKQRKQEEDNDEYKTDKIAKSTEIANCCSKWSQMVWRTEKYGLFKYRNSIKEFPFVWDFNFECNYCFHSAIYYHVWFAHLFCCEKKPLPREFVSICFLYYITNRNFSKTE